MAEVRRFRTKIDELNWTNPETGIPGGHGKDGSGTFHHELKGIIDNSKSLDEFNAEIIKLRDRWQIDPDLLPSLSTKQKSI